MKYRRLTIDELKELEREFHLFLSAHSIPAMEWQKIKSHKPEKAEELIERFSDFILENTLDNIEYLEYKDKNQIQIADVRNDPIQMRGIRIVGNTKVNFQENQAPEKIKSMLMKHGGKLQLISGEKEVQDEPNLAKFHLLQKGFLISNDPTLYNMIKDMQEEE